MTNFDGFPYSSYGIFVGRTEVIDNITKSFQNKLNRILVTGIGDMGKTRLVTELARKWVEDGNMTIFADVETVEIALDTFKCVAQKIPGNFKANEDPVKAVYKFYSDKKCANLSWTILNKKTISQNFCDPIIQK